MPDTKMFRTGIPNATRLKTRQAAHTSTERPVPTIHTTTVFAELRLQPDTCRLARLLSLQFT
jgi:hypothetical protein